MIAEAPIRTVPVGRIKPALYNPRKDLQPGDPEYERLGRSMGEFGAVEPLVWNSRTGNLVGGHQRFKVLKASGAARVQVSVVDLPPAKEKALNLALNRITGSWDEHKLAELLDELSRAPDLDLGLTGFEPEEAAEIVADFLTSSTEGQESFDVEAAMADKGPVVTRPGDVIVLGSEPRLQHRLICGDSTDAATVKKLMGGERASLFATDPPYLVNYTSPERGDRSGASRASKSQSALDDWDNPKNAPELYQRFTAVALEHATLPSAPLYCWHASRTQRLVEDAWDALAILPHQQIVWVKGHGVLGRSWYLWRHEPCLLGWRKGHRPKRRRGPLGGDPEKMLSTIWQVDGLPSGRERPDHPTPKPPELFAIPMRQHTRPGETCYEPFAGSGSQVIAAQQERRRCFALELNPRYCDVIVRRFIAFAGEASVDSRIAKKYRTGCHKETLS